MAKEFDIKDGVLKRYYGKEKNLTIPDGVTSIDGWSLDTCYDLISVKIPEGVTSIGMYAFSLCTKLKKVYLPKSVTSIEEGAFQKCYQMTIISPNRSLASLRDLKVGIPAVYGFIENYTEYTDSDIVAEYIKNISSQRKKYLPEILEKDLVDIIKMLYEAKKITQKNIEQDYLQPAVKSKAVKCVEFLSGLFGNNTDNKEISKEKKDEPAKVIPGQELWDNIHFSFDGKKLLKYKDEPGRTVYDVPEGTREICSEAFYSSKVQEVRIPESVIAIRKDAFYRYKPLFVKLPTGLKKLPKKAFRGAEHYVSTSNAELVSAICFDNSAYPIYMGELDNLNPKEKSYAVIGFLYALRTGLEDMSPWRASYIDHIRRNENTYIKKAQEDEFLISLMIDEKLISYKNVDVLLDSLGKRRNAELIARLLEYKSLLPEKEKKDEFSISNDTPEVKRKIKMAERAEQIKDQKGIQGIAFVSSGRLDNFGWYDYYTGASDMSDLKKYIEERGGFYRSAVSSKTDYLICNDPHSNTTKSKKAAELGVKVITEEEFLKMTNYDGEK